MRSVAVMMILGLMLCCSTVGFAEDPSVLKEVSTSVAGGHTRVAFQFNGDVRFSTEQAKNGIRILFSRTRAAAPQVLNRQAPNAGPLESIGFQRPSTDNLVAVMNFVAGSTYRVMCPSGGNALFVDVNGSAAVRQTAAPKPAPVRTAPAMAEAQPPAVEPAHVASGSSLVDIPAVARRQMELEVPAQARTVRASAGTARFTRTELIALSVVISLLGTGLFLALIVRMARREPAAASVEMAAAAPVVQAIQPRVHRQVQRAPEPDEDDMKPEPDRIRALFNAPQREEEPEEDSGRETSLQLARTFRRGSEEITLARKFHEHPSPALTPAKMQTAMARATTKGQRLTAARKMGVGRGEFDLAEKLKSLSQPPAQEGEGQQ
jgi:hypothetical protein